MIRYSLGVTLDEAKKVFIRSALHYFDGNRSATAKALRMSVRALRTMINEDRYFHEFHETGRGSAKKRPVRRRIRV